MSHRLTHKKDLKNLGETTTKQATQEPANLVSAKECMVGNFSSAVRFCLKLEKDYPAGVTALINDYRIAALE